MNINSGPKSYNNEQTDFLFGLKGRNINEAQEEAKKFGLIVRVVKKNGEHLMVTKEMRENRINVETKDNVIVDTVSFN